MIFHDFLWLSLHSMTFHDFQDAWGPWSGPTLIWLIFQEFKEIYLSEIVWLELEWMISAAVNDWAFLVEPMPSCTKHYPAHKHTHTSNNPIGATNYNRLLICLKMTMMAKTGSHLCNIILKTSSYIEDVRGTMIDQTLKNTEINAETETLVILTLIALAHC